MTIDETPQKDYERTISMLRRAAFCAIVLALLTWCGYVHCETKEAEIGFTFSDTSERYTYKIEKFLARYFEHCSPRKLRRALPVVPVLIGVSKAENVNPILLASMITYESTWDSEAIGKRGEVGLMQIQGSHAVTVKAQLEEGAAMLKTSYEKCGTVFGAVSYYGTGYTCNGYRGARLRIKTAMEIEAIE